MASDATILVIGTFDTKSDELAYLREQIESQGAAAICMDVSVLGDAAIPVEIDKHEVASAAGSSIAEAAAAGDENSAMQIMARGASTLSSQLHADGRIDAMVALGGTMGTDLALDCARVLPTGVPKVIVSTVAFSPLIPADRLAADIAKDSVTRTRQDLFYPELSAVVETSHEKNLDGTIGQRNEQVAKVELTFPFNLGMTAFDSVDASRSSFKATIDRAADTQRTAEETIRLAWADLETARQNHEVRSAQIEIAAKFLELAREEREAGRRSLLDVLSGETRLINAQSDAVLTEVSIVQAAFRLLNAMGRLEVSAVEPN